MREKGRKRKRGKMISFITRSGGGSVWEGLKTLNQKNREPPGGTGKEKAFQIILARSSGRGQKKSVKLAEKDQRYQRKTDNRKKEKERMVWRQIKLPFQRSRRND